MEGYSLATGGTDRAALSHYVEGRVFAKMQEKAGL